MCHSATPWPRHAHQWELLGPPLRPSAEDVAIAAAEAHGIARELCAGAPLRALVLGVTPELVALSWPSGATVLAVDSSPEMIEQVWPREKAPPGATAILADWRAMPVADASVHLVVGDGGLSVFAFPDEYVSAFAEIRRVLVRGGRAVLRLYVPPETPDDFAAITADVEARRVHSFHALKWRVMMALQHAAPDACRLGEVWEAFGALWPDRMALAEAVGCTLEVAGTIDAYQGSTTRYSFPSLADLRPLLAAAFTERACHVPRYELGDRCPTLVLEAR